MPTQLPRPGAETGPPTYTYRPSLIGPAWHFELTEEGLSWRVGRRTAIWPYARIARIRLSYRPVSMQAQRFRADVRNDDGRSVALLSVSWQTAALVMPQDAAYRHFVTELHARIAEAGGTPALRAGISRPVHLAGLAGLAFVNLAMIVLFIRAAITASFSGMLFLVGFAVLFDWTIGRLLLRNRPRSYRIDDPPRDLLP